MIQDALSRLIKWLIHKIGLPTLLTIGLLLVVVSSTTAGLGRIVRGLQDFHLLPLVIFGLLFGWWLARSRLSARSAAALGFVIGLIVLMFHIGQQYHQLGVLAANIIHYSREGWFWQVDWTPVSIAMNDLLSGLIAPLIQSLTWLTKIIQGETATNRVASAVLWSISLYISAFWAGWVIRRKRNPLVGVLPAASLLAISLNYVRARPLYLSFIIAATFLLMILIKQIDREKLWDDKGLDYSEEIRFDLALTSLFFSFALVAIAWMTPSINIRGAIASLNRFAQSQSEKFELMGESLGLEPVPGDNIGLGNGSYAGLPRRHLLGSGPELSEEAVMLVKINDLPAAGSIDHKPVQSSHLYWRSITYDQYTGSGWQTSATITSNYHAGESIFDAAPAASRIVTQQVNKTQTAGQMLFVTGTLLSVDSDYRIAWRTTENDNSILDLFAAAVDDQSYMAQSYVPRISQNQLYSAGSDYPEWIQQRYLSLPENTPPRIHALAAEITGNLPTAYDKVLAIQSYLRRFPYSLDIPAPPAGRDAVDFFLFSLRRGYCDYYASAMVVLARSAGLPARLVSGYATGAYDAENNQYIVTEADAHSWSEIYFPGYGWVEFEPTAARSIFERPEEIGQNWDLEGEYLSPWAAGRGVKRLLQGIIRWQRIRWLVQWFASALVLATLVVGLLILFDIWRLLRIPPKATIFKLYRRLRDNSLWLGIPVHLSDTPYEFANHFDRYILSMNAEKKWWHFLKYAPIEVHQLAELYSRSAFSPRMPEKSDQLQAVRLWIHLRSRLWLARPIQKMTSFIRK